MANVIVDHYYYRHHILKYSIIYSSPYSVAEQNIYFYFIYFYKSRISAYPKTAHTVISLLLRIRILVRYSLEISCKTLIR